MELDTLRSFIALADRLHFGATARALHYSQPALSKRIRALEEELGGPLLVRGRHGARMTRAGELFATEARALLAHADAVLLRGRKSVAGEIGQLRIGFGQSTLELVPRLISRFRAAHPNVDIQLTDLPTSQQAEMLEAGTLDVGFVRLPVARRLQSLSVLEDRLALVVPQTWTGNQRPDAPLILIRRDVSEGLHDRALQLCVHYGWEARVAQQASEFPTVLALVAAGMGISFVPESSLRTPLEGIRTETVPYPPAHWEVGAAWRRESQTGVVDQFIRLIEEHVSRK